MEDRQILDLLVKNNEENKMILNLFNICSNCYEPLNKNDIQDEESYFCKKCRTENKKYEINILDIISKIKKTKQNHKMAGLAKEELNTYLIFLFLKNNCVKEIKEIVENNHYTIVGENLDCLFRSYKFENEFRLYNKSEMKDSNSFGFPEAKRYDINIVEKNVLLVQVPDRNVTWRLEFKYDII